jgi:putative serine protease PepD
MSENNNPQDPGETSRRRGRHGEQDYRTFPTSSRPQSNGPARVSPPVAPPERRPDVPSASQSGYPQQENRPASEQPTQAQNPVDGSAGRGGYPSQQSQPGGQQPGQQGAPQRPDHQGAPQQPGQQSTWQQPQPGGQQSGRPQQGQPQQAQPQLGQPQQGQAQHPSPYQQGGQSQGQQGGYQGQQTGSVQPYPSGAPQANDSNAQTVQSAAYPGAAAQQQGVGSQQMSAASAYPSYAGSQQAGVGSQPGPGYPGGPGEQTGSGGPGYPNGQGGPGEPGAFGAPGYGPYGPEQPTRREKKGPGWGATIAIAAIAALLGGGLAFGGSYAMSAMQGGEPRKVAEQTIETPDWTQVAENTSGSVMSIQVGTNGQVQGLGSGALYDDKGHVITNNHVVAPADTPGGEIAVTMKNGETTEAKIVGRDPSTDIAIIKIKQVPDEVKPLKVGNSKKLSVGDPVMALGNPLGLADTVTTGIVSALDRPVSTENIGEDASSQEKELTITNAIQTDAAINPGNSGGPLVNGDGEFIGVNSAAASLSQAGEGQQSGSIGIGFAIPANQAVMIADQLIANGKALHPFLGITLTDGHINNGGISQGSAKVQSVQGGSPASKAGIKDGDDIVSVGGTKVNNAIALRALVRAQPVNKPVEFTVVRGGKEQKVDVTLVLQ